MSKELTFYDVMNFLLKRFNEIGFKEIEDIVRFANRLRVHHPHINNLQSALVVDDEYLQYGFTKEGTESDSTSGDLTGTP